MWFKLVSSYPIVTWALGSLRVEPLVFRLVCKNDLICKDLAQKKYHVGWQVYFSDNSAYELYSEETLEQDDKTFFLKVQDIVHSAVDELNSLSRLINFAKLLKSRSSMTPLKLSSYLQTNSN